MTDSGFDIGNNLPAGVKLNIPPFCRGNAKLELKDELKTRSIASVRVLVERPIIRAK